ncbi:YVTN repeat-like/Quino protein amine dehydrogenase [Aspergillus eucalypticola CBS 122712]|uniref:Mitochondrial division protein 1 n=1 Tax=Aspergillus eucalypticola (strain CBS 122712 / IBT 29274) TaxID=1448314 RepID=A0A317VRA0_ASPEC|nr:YVTN repeat-like/Quino protein amine dehydrogenase [Aspergillus eucalypticola CBS 122712]PWY76836.1 YVTN repeat-like/Quino protein amine dehydrogenase [Aspergillus eucalypticola CBS 122712]
MSTNPHTLGLWNIAHPFSPHDDLLASCSYLGEVKVWNGRPGSLVHSLENFYPLSVEFSCNGELVASCGWDGTTKLWNSASGKSGHHLNRVYTFSFSPNGELISDWGDGIVRLWDSGVGYGDSTSVSHTSSILSIHPLPRTPQNQLEALKNPSTGPEFSGDGRLVAAFAEETIMIWDTGSGKFIRALELDIGNSDIEYYASIKAAFRPDGKDPFSGKQIETFNGSVELKSFDVSHGGHLLAVTDRTKVGIRKLSTRKRIYLEILYDLRMRMAFSPNDMTLAVLSKSWGKLTLDLWDVLSCDMHCSIDGVTGRYIQFSENGNYMSTVHELYHLETDTEGHPVFLSAVDDQKKVEDGWVCLGKDKILWLPMEYRPVEGFEGFRITDSTLILGSHSDRLLFICFDMQAKRDAVEIFTPARVSGTFTSSSSCVVSDHHLVQQPPIFLRSG